LCRRGVASSTEATFILQKSTKDGVVDLPFAYNIDGGLNEWVTTEDETFPWYEKYRGSFCFLRKLYGVHKWTM
jgi:hypothetical protein